MNRDGTVRDLTGKTVKFRMVNQTTGAVKVNDATATVISPATAGKVKYQWITGDVDTAGKYWYWWIEVSGADKDYYPADNPEGEHMGEIVIGDIV